MPATLCGAGAEEPVAVTAAACSLDCGPNLLQSCTSSLASCRPRAAGDVAPARMQHSSDAIGLA